MGERKGSQGGMYLRFAGEKAWQEDKRCRDRGRRWKDRDRSKQSNTEKAKEQRLKSDKEKETEMGVK